MGRGALKDVRFKRRDRFEFEVIDPDKRLSFSSGADLRQASLHLKTSSSWRNSEPSTSTLFSE